MKTALLGDIANIKGGKRLPKGNTLQTAINTHPYIRIVDMGQKRINKSNLQYVPDNIFPKISRYITNTDDVLISIVGSPGMVALVDSSLNNASLTENCAKLVIDKEKYLAEFIYYYLASPVGQNEIRESLVGSTQPKLPLYNIAKIKLPDLVLEDQYKIVEIVKCIDEKIELNRRMNETLEQIGQTLFKHSFVDSPKVTLNTKIHPKRGSSLTSKQMVEGPFPVVSGGLQPAGHHNESNTQAPVITVSASGANAGFVALWGQNIWSADSSYIDATITKNVYFYYIFLKNNQEKIYGMQTGAAQPHIYPSHLELLEIPDVPEEKIAKFNDDISAMFEKIEENKQEVRILIDLRDSLLPRLISGKIEV